MGDEADRIVINVGGIAYETYISTLQNIPDTRLAWLAEGIDPDPSNRKEIFFDRHSGVFVHILNYYRTGKLHTPTDICGPLFEEELNFWGIDEKQMEPCCWESFTKHREAEVNLKSFEGPGFEDLKNMKNRKFSTFNSQDGMTCRERMDQIWYIMERPHSSKIAKYTSIMSCFMIVLSVTVYCLNTLKSLEHHKSWNKAKYAVDVFCMCWFTIEFTVRVFVCPDRKEFAKSIGNWIDFISVIPSYLKLFSVRDSWLINLVIIRLLRLFRFFKLSYGLQVLVHTLKASFYELILLLLILLIPIVIFSSLVHAIETNLKKDSPTKFTSIPATFWWCLITMTSVGYGDMVPETWVGKIIGSMCAICGVLIVALPISVIGSNFSLYYAHVRARLKLPSKDRKLLAGNIRGLLKQPLSLSSRERDRRVLKRNNVPALKRKGAARNREIVDASNRQSSSATSEEEVAFGSPANKLTSSENCLDWDSTVDSNITFVHKKSRRRQRRKNAECESRLVSGNDSCKGMNDDAAFRRSRRGGQISLHTLVGGTFKANSSSCSSRNVKESETDATSSDESKNNNLRRNSGTLNDENSLDKNVSSRRDSSYRHSISISSKRASMKLMDLEMLPNWVENAISDCGPNYGETEMKQVQCKKNRMKVDIIQPGVTSDTDWKSKNRASPNVHLSGTLNHKTSLCEMKNTPDLQRSDKDYNLIANSVMNCFPTENGKCQMGSKPANIRNSRSECTLLPTFNSASVSETELKFDDNDDVPLASEASCLGYDLYELHKYEDTSLAEETALLNSFQYDLAKEEKIHPAMTFSKSEQDLKVNSEIQDIRKINHRSKKISSSTNVRLLESGI